MREYSYLEIFAIFVLTIICLVILISILYIFWTSFLAHWLGFGIEWRTGDDVWAVITGATDGIGLEYTKQLAQKGYNLMIISRNEDKLKETKRSLKESYANCKQIKTICVDFSRNDIYDSIAEELNNLEDIYVLVNNVGTVYHIPEYYHKIPTSFGENSLNINILSATKMIDIVLPRMLEQGSGIIINLSSQIALAPMPLFATYCATKAYVTFLSQSLSVEYESKGVYVQTVLPNQVKTKLIDNVIFPLVAVTPEQYVSAAIKTVGIEHYTYGHWKHKLLAYLTFWGQFIIGDRLLMKCTFFVTLYLRKNYYKTNNLNED